MLHYGNVSAFTVQYLAILMYPSSLKANISNTLTIPPDSNYFIWYCITLWIFWRPSQALSYCRVTFSIWNAGFRYLRSKKVHLPYRLVMNSNNHWILPILPDMENLSRLLLWTLSCVLGLVRCMSVFIKKKKKKRIQVSVRPSLTTGQ